MSFEVNKVFQTEVEIAYIQIYAAYVCLCVCVCIYRLKITRLYAYAIEAAGREILRATGQTGTLLKNDASWFRLR